MVEALCVGGRGDLAATRVLMAAGTRFVQSNSSKSVDGAGFDQ